MQATVVSKKSWLLYFGIIAPIVRQLVINTTAIITPGYSSVGNYLSELGAEGAPFALSFNFFGITLIGLFLVFAAIGFYEHLHDIAGGQIISWLLALSGLSFFLLGFFPCTAGCIPDADNLQMKMHMLTGTIGLGAQIWAPLMFGLIGFANGLRNRERLTALILGFLGVCGYIYLIFNHQDISFAGLIQRLVQGSADLWLLIMAIQLVNTRKESF